MSQLVRGAEDHSAPLARRHPKRPSPSSAGTWLLLVVLGLAALVRLAGLGHPDRIYFDETYYVVDARAVQEQGVEERRAAHPPLGPLLIAAGMAVAGDNPFGWRLASATFGTLLVGLTFAAGLRLGATPWLAAAAALLVAVDGLAVTMSRIAMLDVFLAGFVLAGFWQLLGALDSRRWGWRLAAAGALLGLAVSAKWSGVFALVAAWGLTAHTVRSRRQDARGALTAVAALTLVPAAVYLGSYTGWFLNVEDSHAGQERCAQGECPQGVAETAVVWWEEQLELIDYHRRLPTTHPYRSPAWSWPLLQRPVLYYLEQCPSPGEEEPCRVAVGQKAKILGLGNPVLWWAALAIFPVLVWQAARRWCREEVALVTFLAFQYLPWLAVGKEGYLFYLLPLVPFMALALTRVLGDVTRLRRWVLPSLVVAAAAAFAYFSPILYGVESHPDVLDSRLWFDSWE